MYALIDCNNFYASCERLFRPDLQTKPIVVLSNNDGCVIARSNEAKALQIKMGEPYFKIKALCLKNNVHVFSSNYALYGDISHRVMSIIDSSWPNIEVYSIDEAFLDLSTLPAHMHHDFCNSLRAYILKSTGIPTSIGMGQTKTLAKIANHICKKELNIPVFDITTHRSWLQKIDVGDVWGVGRQWTKRLKTLGISNAADLASLNLNVARVQFNVVLMRTVMELQGVSCNGVQDCSPSKSIVCSRSFGQMQTELSPVAQALSSHVKRAYEKLRQQHLLVNRITVFVFGNPFRPDLPQYNNKIQFNLICPTDDLRLMTQVAKRCLAKIFKPGFYYKKVGICCEELTSHNQIQMSLFDEPTELHCHKKDDLMNVFDRINQKFGRHAISLAAEGSSKPWAMRSDMKSPHYTTQWSDLPLIRNGT